LLHAVKRIKNRKNETVFLFARVMSINETVISEGIKSVADAMVDGNTIQFGV